VGRPGGRTSLASEPPPETTKLRLFEIPVTCIAPQWAVRELLYAEGFTDVQYVTWGRQTQNWVPEVLVSDEVDISLSFIPTDLIHVDAGEPVVWLAGSHIGCVELIGNDRVGSTRDLKGKTVVVGAMRDPGHIFTSMFAAHVGLDPQTDINWLVDPHFTIEQLAEGKFDACMIGPPASPAVREKNVGHVLVNTTTDKPWSQYFCCMIASTKVFVQQHPVATKRAVRALFSRQPTCAPPGRSRSPGSSPSEPCRLPTRTGDTTTSWRDCRTSRMANGGITIPRTQCDFTHCGCTRLE
jgi:NitT/TauT family transport system substrate-binding protein